VESLEERAVPSASPTLDLTTRDSYGEVNGAIFRQYTPQPTGSGVINSFVRLQTPNGKATVEQGYNTDARPLQFDENNSPNFTRSLKLSDLPTVTIGGVNYRELLLDINQKASQPYVSLDEVRLFLGDAPNLTGYTAPTSTQAAKLPGATLAYDLDAGGDNWVKLDSRLSSGSGSGDMLMYVPDQALSAAGGGYVYLYSKFGVNFAGNSGFEEWAAGKLLVGTPTGGITGTVTTRDSSGSTVPVVDLTVFLDANNNGVLDAGEAFAVTNAAGQYSFSSLAVGLGTFTNYSVSVVQQYNPDGTAMWDQPPTAVPVTVNAGQVTVQDFSLTAVPPSSGGGGGSNL
jgi:hypothetical protein